MAPISIGRAAWGSSEPSVIASGRKKRVLADVVGGKDEGTLFVPQAAKLQGRKRWIAFFHHPKGTLHVDAGANAERFGREGHALRMIARGGRHHAAFALLRRELRHAIARAAPFVALHGR